MLSENKNILIYLRIFQAIQKALQTFMLGVSDRPLGSQLIAFKIPNYSIVINHEYWLYIYAADNIYMLQNNLIYVCINKNSYSLKWIYTLF